VPEAPSDGHTYGRLSAAWTQVLPITGGTLTGTLFVGSGVGSVELSPGTSAQTGYVAFYNAAGTRQGYLGYASGGSLVLTLEDATNTFRVSGSITTTGNVNTTTLFTSAAAYFSYPTAQAFYMNGDGTNNIINFQSGYYFAWNVSTGLLQYIANNASAMQIDYSGNATFAGNLHCRAGNSVFGAGGNGVYLQFAPSWYLDWNATNGTLTWVGPSNALWWTDGSGNMLITGACYAASYPGPSDQRLKRNIQPWTTRGLADVIKLQPVSYEFNGSGGLKDDGVTRYGVVAQDAQTVLPEAVSIMPAQSHAADQPEQTEIADRLAFDNGTLVFVLVNAIKELAAQVASLESRLNVLD